MARGLRGPRGVRGPRVRRGPRMLRGPPTPMSDARGVPPGQSDVVGQLAEQGGLGLGPQNLLDDLAVLEDAHGRDGHDLVPRRDSGVLVNVELDYIDLVAVLVRDLFEHWGHLA